MSRQWDLKENRDAVRDPTGAGRCSCAGAQPRDAARDGTRFTQAPAVPAAAPPAPPPTMAPHTLPCLVVQAPWLYSWQSCVSSRPLSRTVAMVLLQGHPQKPLLAPPGLLGGSQAQSVMGSPAWNPVTHAQEAARGC